MAQIGATTNLKSVFFENTDSKVLVFRADVILMTYVL